VLPAHRLGPVAGDIEVKLQDKRRRGIDEIVAELREDMAQKEPAVDVEFT